MRQFNSSTPWGERAGYFSGDLPGSLTLLVCDLRTESEYRADHNPIQTAMDLVNQAVRCLHANGFSIVAGELEPISRFRSARGALWRDKELNSTAHMRIEKNVNGSVSRIGAVIDLKDIASCVEPWILLSWAQSVIVASGHDISAVVKMVQEWLSIEEGSFAFDFSRMSLSLQSDSSFCVIRYFPPDNGRPEEIAIVGQDAMIGDRARECLCQLRRMQK